MAVYNVELRRSNGSNYDEKIYIKTSVAMIDGLLDANDKIASQWLPSYVLGGMRFCGILDLSDGGNLRDYLESYINSDNRDLAKGSYFIVTQGGSVEQDTGVGSSALNGYVINSPGDEGEFFPTTTLEAGDWIVYKDYTVRDSNYIFEFAVVNNTYTDATVSKKGIIQLATEQDGINGTSITLAMTPRATVAAINARAYSHPTHTAKNETFSAVETLSALSVNSLGHVTSFAKQAIRVASESQTGVIQLASSSEAKAATEDTKATSPLRVKEMIDKFASIELVQSLPTDMSDHPAGKLILLQI